MLKKYDKQFYTLNSFLVIFFNSCVHFYIFSLYLPNACIHILYVVSAVVLIDPFVKMPCFTFIIIYYLILTYCYK